MHLAGSPPGWVTGWNFATSDYQMNFRWTLGLPDELSL